MTASQSPPVPSFKGQHDGASRPLPGAVEETGLLPDERERIRLIVSDAICTKARDQSRPLSSFVVEALEDAGCLRAPRVGARLEFEDAAP